MQRFQIRFDHILFDLPTGERILCNDCKPSGLPTALAVNLERNAGMQAVQFTVDDSLGETE